MEVGFREIAVNFECGSFDVGNSDQKTFLHAIDQFIAKIGFVLEQWWTNDNTFVQNRLFAEKLRAPMISARLPRTTEQHRAHLSWFNEWLIFVSEYLSRVSIFYLSLANKAIIQLRR